MRHACVFPGQGAQYSGMGARLYEKYALAREMFEAANAALGFSVTDSMFKGSAEELKQTHVTQPAVFLHAVVAASCLAKTARPAEAVAGHSLGEFSALVLCGALDFLDGLHLVRQRAEAMQEACEQQPSTMAVVMGLSDSQIEAACQAVREEIVVPANYNTAGQLVISGTVQGIALATQKLQEMGVRRVLPLAVGGAFHSPLMRSAQEKLSQAIENTTFHTARIPIYQNIDGLPSQNTADIKKKLIKQLTAPVRWQTTIETMQKDGFTSFTECGPGKVLQGLIKKTAPAAEVSGCEG